MLKISTVFSINLLKKKQFFSANKVTVPAKFRQMCVLGAFFKCVQLLETNL